MKRYFILAGSLLAVGSIMLIQQFYTPVKQVNHYFSSTEFIEPDASFIACYKSSDCIKIKGSACPPSEGGKEVCVNKNNFQEYISDIDRHAGSETEIVCPQVYMVTNKACECSQSVCSLV